MKVLKLVTAGLASAICAFTAPALSAAENFPERNITIVVPFPPGGTSDMMARTIAKGMSKHLDASVLVDNKGGGGTLIGSQYVARSNPDGYTLLLAATPHAINPSLYKNIPYDTKKEFRTIAYMTEMPLLMAVPSDSDIQDIETLVERLKSNNDLSYSSSGVGGSPHLATALFLTEIGGDAVHVPYRGSNPSVMDLAAGRVDFAFDTLYLIMTQVDTGRLRPIMQSGAERHPRIPDVPTAKDIGLEDYEVTSWFSMAAPAATPDAVVNKLNEAINATLQDPEVRELLVDQLGMTITGGSAEEAQARLLREIETWTRAVEISGATME